MEISAINNVSDKMVVREVLSNYAATKINSNETGSRPTLTTEKHQTKEIASLSDKQINDLADKLNKLANNENLSLQFSVDTQSGQQIMQFIDQSTKQVVQQFPSEEMVKLAAQIDKFLEKNQKLFPPGSILSERI